MLKAFNALEHTLSSADVGSFLVAVVELRCLDEGDGPSAFSRVRGIYLFFYFYFFRLFTAVSEQSYWIEALSLITLSERNPTDDVFMEKLLDFL